MELNKRPKGSNSSLRSHLEQVYKQTGVKPKQLAEQPEKPEELEYLYNWFLELVRFHVPLTYAELESWSRLTKVDLKSWETHVLINLEQIYRNSINE